MSVLFIFLLSAWLLVSVIAQLRRVRRTNPLIKAVSWLKWRDYCALIPSWSFFAPNPGTSDYRLLYRDKLCDEQYTAWKEVEFPSDPLIRWVWNPGKRAKKALVDMCSSLMSMASRDLKKPSKMVYISVPYITLLTYVSRQPRSPLSEHTQFMIAATFGRHEPKGPEILFISPLHQL